MSNCLSIIAGSTQPALTLTIKNSNGTFYDFTGCTVKLRVALATPLEKVGSTPAPTTGVAYFTWLTTDLTTPGTFDAQLVIDSPADGVWVAGGFRINVVRAV